MTSPSFESTGLILPKVHLGSLMDVGDYFDTYGRRPNGDQRAERQQQQPMADGSYGAPSLYGLTAMSATASQPSPVMREKSLSSEGRVWKPRPSPPPHAATIFAAPQQGSPSPSPNPSPPLLSPSSPDVPRQPSTPPTQDTDPVPADKPRSTSPADRPVPTEIPNPAKDSPSPRPLSYLPPGAASPQHLRTSLYTNTTSIGMAGVGSGSWMASPSIAQIQQRGTSSSPDPVRSRSPAAAAPTGRSQNFGTGGSPTMVSGGQMDRNTDSTRAGQPGDANSYVPAQNGRRSTGPGPSSPSAIRDDGRINYEPQHPTQQHIPAAGPPVQASRNPQSLMPPVDQRQPQPQTRGGPRAAAVVVEEVCIECMMRDRDMADIDVTGEGVWERDSDVWYRELVRREEEEEIRSRLEGVPVSTPVSSNGRSRPRARGGRLTEENVKVWLTMNPKEPHARWQTLEAYLKSQSALLVAEAAARAQTQRESRLMENRVRESYSQIKRSGHETVSTSPRTSGIAVRVAATPNAPYTPPVEKDATLLENGLIVEKVDLKKEEREERARMRSLERNERQRRRMSSAALNDGGSVYNASIYSGGSPAPDTSSHSFLPYAQPNGHPGPYAQVAQASAAQLSPGSTNRRFSSAGQPLSPSRPTMQRGASQASNETGGTGVRRFFGYKHWGGGGSQTSLAMSGSMMDMHLGLDQDRKAFVSQDIPYDLSAPPSLEFVPGDPTYADRRLTMEPDSILHPDDKSGTSKSKKKSKGIGKLWKLMTGGSRDDEAKAKASHAAAAEEDLSAPLAPPPPLSYLVSGRSDRSPHSRHASSPSLSGGSAPHPRSVSAPLAQSATGISPPTAPSSLLPSPTSNRFPWRDSGSDDPRGYPHRDEADHDVDANDDRRVSQMDPRMQRASTVSPVPPRGYSIDKSLPPLPPDSLAPPHPQAVRPNTLYAPHTGGAERDLAAPNAPFRQEGRRSSFNGVTNKLTRQTWMVPEDVPFAPPPAIGSRYDEFGGSRLSLGKLEDMRGTRSSIFSKSAKGSNSSSTNSKSRGSRFGLSSLFSPSKKHQNSSPPTIFLGSGSSATLAPGRGLDYHQQHARENSTSHSSAFSDFATNPKSNGSHTNPRASVASSKKLALIVQDEDFVAYRYPSSQSQTLPYHR